MVKKFTEFLNQDVSANGFRLTARDAHDTAKNINSIFIERTGWFQKPKPIHIEELKAAYKALCPGMEIHYPGVLDKIFQPELIAKLGYPVDEQGMVHWQP